MAINLLARIIGPIEALTAKLPIEDPGWLLLIPVAFLILLIVINRDFVKVALDNSGWRRRRKARIWIFVSRMIIFTFLAIAMTMPYIEVTEETAGNPQVTLLIDESNSMKVLDTSFVDELKTKLKERIPVTVRSIASGDDSALGDAILDNLEPGRHVLLVSDGNSISGTPLEDVAFYATNQLNASVSGIILEPSEEDASVYISGPETVVAGTSNTFFVKMTATDDRPRQLVVTIDGITAYDQFTEARSIAFEKEFSVGTHRLEAHIMDEDYDPQNNAFYKTVEVLEKPRILLLSEKDSLLDGVLDELYTVTKQRALPQDLNPYYAIVANDVPANRLRDANALHEYLIDESGGFYGNGLVVIGGFNSYDRGDYQNSPVETLLPVKVGKGESKKGDDNIVLIMDISGGSTGVRHEKKCNDNGGDCHWVEVHDDVSALDVIKAQAVNLISSEQNIIATNRVGVIAFGAQGTVEDRSQGHYQASDTVKVVEPLDFLYNNQGRLKEKIPRLIGGGPSEIGLALQAAYDMLQNRPGANNYVLVLTDGNVGPSVQKEAFVAIDNLRRRNVKVFTYGVGRSTPNIQTEFLKAAAETGDGLYEGPVITTRDVHPARISIMWGNPDQKGFGDEFGLITFSLTHFITKDLELSATLNGFNQVTPKSTAQMLVRTDFGQPALTTWNYGNGRVAALTVFTGNGLGELLNAENSLLMTRTVNWAIGDPQRKEGFYVKVDDARVGEPTSVTIKSKEPITSDEVEFIKEGDTYTASFTPYDLGFGQFFGATYGTNYPREYQYVGMNPDLNVTLELTGGKLFSPDEIDEIVAHVSELSRRRVVEREPFTWPFISAALVVFLIEVFIRRLTQFKKKG